MTTSREESTPQTLHPSPEQPIGSTEAPPLAPPSHADIRRAKPPEPPAETGTLTASPIPAKNVENFPLAPAEEEPVRIPEQPASGPATPPLAPVLPSSDFQALNTLLPAEALSSETRTFDSPLKPSSVAAGPRAAMDTA